MANLLTLTKSFPVLTLKAGDALMEAGEAGGELYVLQSGKLAVERDGIQLTTISEPGSMIGEMSVLLGIDHSATVRALGPVEVRVIEGAIDFLEATPIVALHVATMVCARLDATSALLVEMRKSAGKQELSFFERLFGAVSGTETDTRAPR